VFRIGNIITYIQGNLYSKEEFLILSQEDHNRSVQVDDKLYLGPKRGYNKNITVNGYLNYSFTPNCGIRQIDGYFAFVALREISTREELTGITQHQ